MQTGDAVEVLESWKITDLGIIAELRHQRIGLPQGTRLLSGHTGLQWIVKTRLFFNHAMDEQKKFENETAGFMHMHFANAENRENSRRDIIKREALGISQYTLDPDSHEEKPAAGDLLFFNFD